MSETTTNFIYDCISKMNATSVTLSIPDFSAVSSQYGPGPIIGWMLAALSVLLSWTYERSNGDTAASRVSADFVTTILFPLIAAGDIAMQLYHYPGPIVSIPVTSNPFLQQRIHAIEAPLVLLELAMIANIVLCMVGLHRKHRVKAIVLVAINICGLGIETYLLSAAKMHECKRPHKNFTRSYLAHSPAQVICAWIFTIFPLLYIVQRQFISPKKPSCQANTNTAAMNAIESQIAPSTTASTMPTTNAMKSFSPRRVLAWSAAVCLSSMVWVILGSMAGNSMAFASQLLLASGGPLSSDVCAKSVKLFFKELMPCTSYSITDLDQIIPVVGGGCLLGLNVYGIVRDRTVK